MWLLPNKKLSSPFPLIRCIIVIKGGVDIEDQHINREKMLMSISGDAGKTSAGQGTST